MTTDVIVIGGGIAGASVAAHLAAHMSVQLLEAEPHPGYHATGRSAAIFIRNYGNATLRALTAASRLILTTPGDLADGSLLSPRGQMMVAGDTEEAALDAYLAGAEGMEILTPGQAVKLVPVLRREAIQRAAIEWDAQDIDVDRLLWGYLRLFKRRGGRLETNARVTTLSKSGKLWRVSCGSQEFAAPLVINAAGAWATMVNALAGGVPVPLIPMRRSAALLPAPEGHDIQDWPLFVSASEKWYAKPDAGKLLVSPADEDPVEPHDAWPDDMVLAEGLYRFEEAVTCPVTRVERSWAGLRTFAPDRSPMVGPDPRAEGLFWLAGQGGYGVQTAPALARLCEQLVIGFAPDLPPEVVAAVSPSRFGE